MKKQAKSKTPDTVKQEPFQPDTRRALDLAMKLMAIPGTSGQEGQVAEFIKAQLLGAGVPTSAIRIDSAHRRTPEPGDTGNLVLKLPGTTRRPRRMFSAHMDTVPVCVGSQPVLDGDILRSADPNAGLGADNRAGVAVVLNTALELVENDLPHPPLAFCWFVQEETGLQGSRCVGKSLLGGPKMAFNWDGGSPAKLTIGATGGYRLAIEVRGIASHAGGAPEHGVSAIAIASLAIADLFRNGWHGDIHKGRNCGTSNVGVIQGGNATNVVTDRVLVKAEARSHNSRFRERIVAEIEKAFRRAAREVKNVAGATGAVTIDGRLDYEAFRLAPKEPCVEAAASAVRSIGREPELAIANGGLDANWLFAHGIPTVSLGCGQLNQHMISDSMDVAGFKDACQIALRLATANEI
ncbi:MAG: M20/M25/M40 family metallo-hydrolase [Planctomycetes bacterium]|nr:M20/M25/M40 family metallo-hydrolase [Planctomycetota bacterium]MBL7040825.1 M20/M25/M40 family metallo-hydrolase [Pirellulaceae bacterium]